MFISQIALIAEGELYLIKGEKSLLLKPHYKEFAQILVLEPHT